MKLAGPLDAQRYELLRLRFEQLAAAPGTPVEGQAYWDTALKMLQIYNGAAWGLKASDAALLNAQNAAFYLARGNHTGTQLASTISDLAATVKAYLLNEFGAPNGPVAMGTQKITGLANGTNPADAVNFSQLESARQARRTKDAVRVRTSANVVLATPGANLDGVAMVAGDRFFAAAQTTTAEIGIYVWNGAAVAATRADDADVYTELQDGAELFVQQGTSAEQVYRQTATLASFAGQTWVLIGAGTTYVAGTGLAESPAGTFNVTPGIGINAGTGDQVAIDTAVVARKYTTLLAGAGATFVVNHALANQWVTVQIVEVATLQLVEPSSVVLTDANNVTVTFGTAPGTNTHRAIVVG